MNPGSFSQSELNEQRRSEAAKILNDSGASVLHDSEIRSVISLVNSIVPEAVYQGEKRQKALAGLNGALKAKNENDYRANISEAQWWVDHMFTD